MPIPTLATAALEQALNRMLRLDPGSAQQLATLHGRVIGIEFLGLGLQLYLVPGSNGIQVLGQYEGEPDCLLRGTPLALSRMGRSGTSDTDQLFSGAVEIRGDTELGHNFGRLLSELDIDWEEQISRVTGDLLAHQIGSGFRAAHRWGRRTLATFGEDLHEYLQEETRILPSAHEVNAFLEQVDILRDDTERLAARLTRLQQRTGTTQEPDR